MHKSHRNERVVVKVNIRIPYDPKTGCSCLQNTRRHHKAEGELYQET